MSATYVHTITQETEQSHIVRKTYNSAMKKTSQGKAFANSELNCARFVGSKIVTCRWRACVNSEH